MSTFMMTALEPSGLSPTPASSKSPPCVRSLTGTPEWLKVVGVTEFVKEASVTSQRVYVPAAAASVSQPVSLLLAVGRLTANSGPFGQSCDHELPGATDKLSFLITPSKR